MSELVPYKSLQEDAENRILNIRGQNVILDSDLAEFYGVMTGNLNQRATENKNRFPEDFRFQLTEDEYQSLLYENRIAKMSGRGGRRTRPWVYTAEGALAASGIIKSKIADEVAVAIPRAFKAMSQKVRQLDGIMTHVKELRQAIESKADRTEVVSKADKIEVERANREIADILADLGKAIESIEKRLPLELEP